MVNVELRTSTVRSMPARRKHPTPLMRPLLDVPGDKGHQQSGDHDCRVVPMLPHDDRILSESPLIGFGAMRSLHEQPPAVTVPESFLRVVGILIRVRSGVVPDMIGTPEQRRVLQRPATGYQQADFHPRPAFEAAMRNHPVIAHRNSQAGDDVENDEKSPVERSKVIKIRKQWDAEHCHEGHR